MAIAFRTSPVVAVLPFGHQANVFFAGRTLASMSPRRAWRSLRVSLLVPALS